MLIVRRGFWRLELLAIQERTSDLQLAWSNAEITRSKERELKKVRQGYDGNTKKCREYMCADTSGIVHEMFDCFEL